MDGVLRNRRICSSHTVPALALIAGVLFHYSHGFNCQDPSLTKGDVQQMITHSYALSNAGVHREALACLDRAHTLIGGHPAILNALGQVRASMGDVKGMEEAFLSAMKIAPEMIEIWYNYAQTLQSMGLTEKAMKVGHEVLDRAPDHDMTHNFLGINYQNAGMLEKARHHLMKASQTKPSVYSYTFNLANVEWALGNFEAAEKGYIRSLGLEENPGSHNNLALLYEDGGLYDDALKHFRKALDVTNWTYNASLCNLVHATLTVCDWEQFDETWPYLQRHVEDSVASQDTNLCLKPWFAFAYPLAPNLNIEMTRLGESSTTRMQVGGMAVYKHVAGDPKYWTNLGYGSGAKRLRIGYTSSDLGGHPLTNMIQGMFGAHDRTLFEVYCYSLESKGKGHFGWEDIERECEHFLDVSGPQWSAPTTAERINRDKVLALVNLNGWTKGDRNTVYVLRPVPLQIVTCFAYPGTMAMEREIPFFVSDPIVSPPEMLDTLTEKVVYMPNVFQINTIKTTVPLLSHKADEIEEEMRKHKFSPGDVVLLSFNQAYKYDRNMVDLWLDLLRRHRNVKLWVLNKPSEVVRNLRTYAKRAGVNSKRIVASDMVARERFLLRTAGGALFLDTSLCNAHSTGTDTLWMGTPVVTRPGHTIPSRIGASLLANAGIPECIARSPEEYADVVDYLLKDPRKLKALQDKLKRLRPVAPLFDTSRFMLEYERAVRNMWEVYVNQGESLMHVAVGGKRYG